MKRSVRKFRGLKPLEEIAEKNSFDIEELRSICGKLIQIIGGVEFASEKKVVAVALRKSVRVVSKTTPLELGNNIGLLMANIERKPAHIARLEAKKKKLERGLKKLSSIYKKGLSERKIEGISLEIERALEKKAIWERRMNDILYGISTVPATKKPRKQKPDIGAEADSKAAEPEAERKESLSGETTA